MDLVAQLPEKLSPTNISLTVPLTTDGMNEAGLTVSVQVFAQSGQYSYMQPSTEASDTNVCFAAFTDWILATFDSVKSLREALNTTQVKIVGPSPALVQKLPSFARSWVGLHWSIDDASEHIVLEVLDGIIHMHNNTVGVMTNQPDFTWHLRNLNNFVNLRSGWPSNPEIQVQTEEVGPVPNVAKAGHGFNLLGIPGDYSPPSRFVRLFYLREYAVLRNPPKERQGEAKYTDSIALVTGLLNNVFINKGTVPDPNSTGFGEYSQYTVLKIPEARLFFYKDYVGTQWRKVKLENLDFSSKEGAPPITVSLVEGTVSIKDVTADFTAPPPASSPSPPAQPVLSPSPPPPVAIASPPPAAPVAVASPPPSPPPCQSALDLEGCNGKCSDEFDACMNGKDECNTSKQCKKACKNKRTTCKDTCDAATKCPACEDNDISGFGTPWCETNAVSSTFCASAHGAKKCKKTCDLCD